MAVSAVLLVDDVSLMLVRDGVGWRFHAWARSGLGIDCDIAAQPTRRDRDRHFTTSIEAIEYFRRTYGTMVRTIVAVGDDVAVRGTRPLPR